MGELRAILAVGVAVGTDILAGDPFAKVPHWRVIFGRMMAGGATAGAAQVDLYVSETRVAQMHNSSLGEGAINTDLFPLSVRVPPNTQLRAIVVTAPLTNPGNMKLFWKP